MAKNNYLKHYWFEFDLKNYSSQFYIPSIMGYGVTAYSIYDAKNLLKDEVFKNNELPNLLNFKENITFSDIESNHIVPNIGLFNVRGVWFPNMNLR